MRRETRTAPWVRRMISPTAALLGAAVLLGGCGQIAAEVEKVTAKQTLLASVPDDGEGPFRFTGKDVTGTIAGVVDPAAKAMDLTTSAKDPEHGFSTHIAFRILGDDVWTKISFTETEGLTGLPKLPKKWLKLDRSKFTDAGSVPVYDGADQGNAGPLVQAATSVQDDGSGKYSGTIDLTSGEAAKVLDADQMTALGDAAKKVPFTAVVGADQNLSSLTLEVPAAGTAKAFQYVVNYQDYGSAPKVVAPKGSEAQNAPALAYEILNG